MTPNIPVEPANTPWAQKTPGLPVSLPYRSAMQAAVCSSRGTIGRNWCSRPCRACQNSIVFPPGRPNTWVMPASTSTSTSHSLTGRSFMSLPLG